MSLSATLNIAQSALATNANLSSLVSRNIAGVNDTNYSRKIANLATAQNGTGSIVSVGRASDKALFTNLLSATADAAASAAVAAGLDQLEGTVSIASASSTSTKSSSSPATLIGKLTTALSQYAATPGDATAGQAALSAAKSLASALNAASATVQNVRTQADADIAAAVADVNSLLGQFQTVNTAIVKATTSGSDATDLLDQRDALLVSLSGSIGIGTVAQANGGLSIYTDSGVTLFQDTPRTVSFAGASGFTAGTTGGAVMIDGVPVTGGAAVMPLKSGRIAGLTDLRDTTATAYQDQLDQIAGGLVTAFAESDQTGGTAPTISGLFTDPGVAVPPSGTTSGLASRIAINASVDPTAGGTLSRLRDGTIGDPTNTAYAGNTTGAASYSARLTAIATALGTSRSFDGTSGGAAQGTLADFATASVGWLEASRQTATTAATNRSAVATQTKATLSSTTGVNLDEQLSLMLDLEHSYQASAELMSTVKSMFGSLLSAMQ